MKHELRNRKGVYPFPEMEVGDYFDVDVALQGTVTSTASYHSKKSTAWGFRTFTLPCKTKVRCMRVW